MFNHKNGYSSSFTLFVDNLPDDVGPRWFRHLFSQFGLVRRVFIPKKKRSKRSGQPFGFVTFGSNNEASYAISKLNSLRLDGRYLVVKWARFRPKGVDMTSHNYPMDSTSSSQPFAEHNVGKFGIYGTGPVMEPYNQPLDVDESTSFYVKPIASEWLSRSAVVLLKSPSTPEIVLKALEQANFPDVVVKSLGGLSMILTFTSKEVRNLALTDSTLIDWFISLKPWNGESASLSRFVWLKCRGMPLQSWNVNTFKRIGDYCGVFINTDAETALEQSYDIGRILISTDYQERIEEWINLVVNGKLYKVKIWEEDCDDPFNIIFKGKENTGVQTGLSFGEPANPKGVTSGKLPLVTSELDMDGIEKSEEDNGATHNEGVVEKIDDLEDGNDENDIVSDMVKDTTEPVNGEIKSTDKDTLDIEEVPDSDKGYGLDSLERILQLDNDISLDSTGSSSGFELSIVGDTNIGIGEDFNGPTPDQEKPTEEGSFVDEIKDTQLHPVKAAINGIKGKKKRKTINDILGFSKVNPHNKKGGGSKKKCVVLRSAVAAAALSASISSDGIANRNRIILNKAQTIWELNKLVGIGYEGDEKEVISKIAEKIVEENDKASYQF